MSNITSQEQILLDSRPHRTKLYLSIYQPSTVLAAQVNDASIAKGERTITYDSVSSGSHLLVEAGMTLLVGSEAGDDSKGKVRIKSIDGSEIEVAENSHIDWEDDDYLTVLHFFEINAVYPRIIQDPSDPENTLWYKDYDIEYSDQNSNLGAFICMGPHHAGFLEGGSHQVYYTATGTSSLDGGNSTYSWWFQGAAGTTGTSAETPGYITYDTPGQYTTRLIVTTDNGKTETSYRHISIYDRPENGTNNPIILWGLEDLSGSRNDGGYTGRIRIRESIPEETIRDGSLIVIFADDWYDGTKQSIGGNAENRQSIVFVGYIIDGSINYNYRQSYVEFDVGSATEIMKSARGFSVSVQDSNNPSAEASSNPNVPSGWVAVKDLSIERALYHYLKWHSTVISTTDIQFNTDDILIQYFDSDRESLYDAINTLMSTALIGSSVCDRQGKLWFDLQQGAVKESDLPSADSLFKLYKNTWIGIPTVEERQTKSLSFLEVGGIAYSGISTGTFSPLLSSAPGSAPDYRGGILQQQGLALVSQAQLNELAGNVLANRNSRYPNIDFRLSGNYRNIDIAPRQNLAVTIDELDTNRGISFNDKRFVVERMFWSYNPNKEYVLPGLSVSETTSGFSGDTIVIPPTPPTEGGTGPDDGGGDFGDTTINIDDITLPNPTIYGLPSKNYYYGSSAPKGTSVKITWSSQATKGFNDGITDDITIPSTGFYFIMYSCSPRIEAGGSARADLVADGATEGSAFSRYTDGILIDTGSSCMAITYLLSGMQVYVDLTIAGTATLFDNSLVIIEV